MRNHIRKDAVVDDVRHTGNRQVFCFEMIKIIFRYRYIIQ